jgi:hypothetical protein
MDRRNFLAVVPIVAAMVAAPASIAAEPVITSYFAELDAIDREAARLNAGSFDQASWDRWEAWSNRVYREIEAMPASESNAKLTARAIWSIGEGSLEDLNLGESVACRLVRQMVSGLAA